MNKTRVYALCFSAFLVGIIVSALVSAFVMGRMVQAAGPGPSSGNPHTNSAILCPGCTIDTDPGEHGLLGSYDFRNAYMPSCHISSTSGNLDGIDFSGADLYSCGFRGLTARHARFVGTYFSNSFANMSDLSYSDFSHAKMNSFKTAGSNFTGANFTSADLSAPDPFTVWQQTNFTGANFTDANLSGIKKIGSLVFTGTIWSNTTCPDGTNSDADGHTCVGHFLSFP